ncbi:hypothetical protein BT93_C0997 [Corymbia citriodora subsp. variegata]|nr:hypothetical protein BT93_C0997 [Corymbia citriodora subsp. variegata]
MASAAQNQPPNVDLFDLYFTRADLDRDGRISGLEAVTFFQASGLPKPVLAKVWDYADQKRTGFLGRAEFYNALKLVTVAQKKRELTPEIVKAALYSPAAAKIPAPQINLPGVSAPQPNTSTQAAAPQAGVIASSTPQSLGFGGSQAPLGVNLSQQQFSSQAGPLRPPAVSASTLQPTQGAPTQSFPVRGAAVGPSLPNSSISSDWTGGMMGRPPSGTIPQVANRGVASSMTPHGFGISTSGHETSLPPRPQAPSATPSRDPKQMGVSGNGFASDSFFGEGAFSASQPQPRQESSALSAPNSSATSLSAANQPSVRPNALESLQTSFAMQPVGGQPRPAQSNFRPAQQVSAASTSTFSSPVVSPPSANAPSSQSQMPWPKMTQTDVQKYMKVFVEVDKDKDGKITGEQARNLFLSWRLPREILKQVWDLSDQDNDSMLSLREFCIALYLLERYREGRTLPTVLPSNILFDQPGQPSAGYANVAWAQASGLQQQGTAVLPVSQHMAHPPRGRPPRPPAAPPSDDVVQPKQQKKVPVLEKHLVDQLSKEEQSSLGSRFQEAMDADKKVEELEKEIMDSKEKIEFYRTKMQELVLYKSRCDNRLNEIMERVSGDKREVEGLAKKYEEKCRQAGDVASKLTIEEATFRDLQEKKMELYRAIVSMEKDGADGALQGRADHIQLDLDELVKNLNERCKKYGLRAKPTSLLELPFGWQHGIQETAADWDEDWDKFEEEGFTFVKEFTLDVQNVIAPPKQKSSPAQVVKPSVVQSPVDPSLPQANVDKEKPLTSDGHVVENGIHHNKNEDGTPKSKPSSPAAPSTIESPSRDFADSGYGTGYGKTTTMDSSLHYDKEISDHEAAGSVLSGDRSFDEPAWGTFDTNDDVDSVWGFNPLSASKDTDHEGFKDDSLFGSMEFGLNPIRTGLPQAGFQKKSMFFDESVPSTPLYTSGFSPRYSEPSRPSLDSSQKKSIFFDESVPSTPLYTSGFSPKYSEPSGLSFDSSSRFDSFNIHDSGVFSQRDTFSRFDSFNTQDSRTFPQRDTFSRFDSFSTHDGESFPQRETLTRFDSMRSSVDFDQGHGFPSFDDSDPFGTGPFRTSKESQTSDNWGHTPKSSDNWGNTPKSSDHWGHTPKSSDNWSAF